MPDLLLHPASDTIAARADFGDIRYGLCWEDADVLLDALDVQPGDHCLSIASAGDNTLALLTRDVARVVAIDLSPAQLACLALRVAAYRTLTHPELLELVGEVPSDRRWALYIRCRPLLSPGEQAFWDGRPALVAGGIGRAGRFEAYLTAFRRYMLPLLHGRRHVARLFTPSTPAERAVFYDGTWDGRRWRALFRLFFSRAAMGRFGRDPAFFDHVEGGVAGRLLARARHAAVQQDPSTNPYLRWILTGRYGEALPLALRPEHFDAIRSRLDRLAWRHASLEETLDAVPSASFDRFNLSNVFEYVDAAHYARLLAACARAGRSGGRLVYWNLFVPRTRPDALAAHLRPLEEEAAYLHDADHAFFYDRLVIEAIC